MSSVGKALVALGIVLVFLGLVVWGGEKLLGRQGGLLPGDIVYRRGNFTLYFPLVTCILLSAVLTLAMWLFSALRR